MADLPHFAYPFQYGADGTVNVVEQNTPDEIAACVANIAVCPSGYLPHDPALGIDDLAFSTIPLDLPGLIVQVSGQEPRVTLDATETGDAVNAALRTIVLTASVRGGPGA